MLETDRDYVGEVKVEDTDAKKVYNKKSDKDIVRKRKTKVRVRSPLRNEHLFWSKRFFV